MYLSDPALQGKATLCLWVYVLLLQVCQSGELIFIDSEHNLRFFLLCTHSVAGALPLGVMITSDEKESTIAKAVSMLCGNLPAFAFFHRGCEG